MSGAENIHELDDVSLSSYLIELLHSAIIHHGLWFAEVVHQMGPEQAMLILDDVAQRSIPVQIKRLADALGFEAREGIPSFLSSLPAADRINMASEIAKNWLANDGIWFQAVEQRHGMNDAKRCNDSCWGRFSPWEAHAIKKFLKLSPEPGLDGLALALQFRLYAHINEQTIIKEGPGGIIFRMTTCRVQEARKRKGLPDYPCKSAGLVEYTRFAETIDPRIKTQCIGCPPDDHPLDWSCAWRFFIE